MRSRLLRQWPRGRKDPQGGQSLKEDEGWLSGRVAGPAVDGLAFEKKNIRRCGSLVAGARSSMLSWRARFGGGLVAGILSEDAPRSSAHVHGRVY